MGYNTLTINKKYTLLTVNFDDVGGGALDIQKAFPYCEGMTKGLSDSSADNIQIMTEDGGYETYFLSDGHYGKGGLNTTKRLTASGRSWGKTQSRSASLRAARPSGISLAAVSPIRSR